MEQRWIGKTIQAFTTPVPTGSILGFSGLPGQIGIVFRYVSGGSLEIGGASLTAGKGFLIPTSPATTLPYSFVTDTVYAIATGATCIATGYRIISAENPGNLG